MSQVPSLTKLILSHGEFRSFESHLQSQTKLKLTQNLPPDMTLSIRLQGRNPTSQVHNFAPQKMAPLIFVTHRRLHDCQRPSASCPKRFAEGIGVQRASQRCRKR